MNHKIVNGWVLLSLLMSTLVYAYPQSTPIHTAGQYIPQTAQQQAEYQQHQYLRQQQPQPRVQHYQVHSPPQYQQYQQQPQLQQQQQQQQQQIRKFAEKPNALKKVSLDDIDSDIQTNQIDGNGAFSWTNMVGSLMQMFLANNNMFAPAKTTDDSDGNGIPASPWTNVIAAGLKIITTLLGGGGGADGIDKVDNGNVSPMQSILAAVFQGVLGAKDPDQVNIMAKQAGEFINIVVNLLDALKTSFSHRSLTARSSGRKDSVSDLGIASITMLKGYVKTTGNASEKCMQKYMCEANTECNNDIGGNSIFCQMGSYATSFVLERTTGNAFEKFYEAGRHGRQGGNCRELYIECSDNQ